MGNALHTKGAGAAGVTDHPDARLDDAGLIAVGSGGLISARTGVLAGPGATALVTGTSSTGTMRYSVAAHHWVTNRGVVSDGVYRGAAETAKLVDTTAAPGTGSRIDIIYVKQNDAGSTLTPDATSAPVYGCVQGASSTGTPNPPSLPVGAEEVARATVLTGATRTDDGTKVTISQTAKLTTTRGGVVPIRAATELAGLPAYPSAQALELDTGRLRWHDGTRWRYDGDVVVVADATARGLIADAYAGLAVLQRSDWTTWFYTGSAWVGAPSEADTGWMDVGTNGSTASSVAVTGNGLKFRRKGGRLLVRGEVNGTWTANQVLTTFPVGFRLDYFQGYKPTTVYGGGQIPLSLLTNGQLVISTPAQTTAQGILLDLSWDIA